jgi:hypothetical protein
VTVGDETEPALVGLAPLVVMPTVSFGEGSLCIAMCGIGPLAPPYDFGWLLRDPYSAPPKKPSSIQMGL